MTTKNYLQQIKRYERMINNKLFEIYQLKTMAYGISVEPHGEKVQTSLKPDKIGEVVAKIVDMEREVDDLIDRFSEKRNTIIEQIDSMENDEQYDVLTQKYVRGVDFEDIPGIVGMSRRKMFRVYKEAMEEFEGKYGAYYLSTH